MKRALKFAFVCSGFLALSVFGLSAIERVSPEQLQAVCAGTLILSLIAGTWYVMEQV